MEEAEDSKEIKVIVRKKQKLSLEAKRELCKAWAASGESKKAFCQKHGLTSSAFYRWQNAVSKEKKQTQQRDFVPIIHLPKKDIIEESKKTVIEVILPNQAIIRMTLPMVGVVPFIQELCHAVTTLR